MTKLRLSAPTFTAAFCCAYAAAFALNWPLFLYYPLHGDLTWGWQVMKGAGPTMVWYGLMADAAIVGLLAAIVLPNDVVDRLFRNYLWVFPCAAMLACLFLLRHFFV